MRNVSIPVLGTKVEISNLKPLNDYITECTIRVLYAGPNRNKSYISEEVAEKYIAPSLPNKPIVGYFDYSKGDFLGHEVGLKLSVNGEMEVGPITVPFGVVASDTSVWWESFIDNDGITRKYLMCKGYIWSNRYPETTSIITEGKNVSMELVYDSIEGYWAKIDNLEDEYYIITKGSIDAICILGDDVEPCFEGAAIEAKTFNFSLDNDKFKEEMDEFMTQLKQALQYNINLQEGGLNYMDNLEKINEVEEIGQDNVNTTEENVDIIEDEVIGEDFSQTDESIDENATEKLDNEVEEPVEEVMTEEQFEEKSEPQVDYATMLQDITIQYNEIKEKYELLLKDYEVLKNELKQYELEKKNSIFAKYGELTEEEVVDLKENIDNYSIEQLDIILAARAYKKVKNSFSLNTETKEKEVDLMFNLNTEISAPSWVKTILNKKKTF